MNTHKKPLQQAEDPSSPARQNHLPPNYSDASLVLCLCNQRPLPPASNHPPSPVLIPDESDEPLLRDTLEIELEPESLDFV